MNTIATWNVNSIRMRLNSLDIWIKEREPDIILLQETKCVAKDFPFQAFNKWNYNIKLLGQKSYNGVAILSKYPIEDVTYQLSKFPEDDGGARYIEAFTGGVRVASVYVPNGQMVGSEKFAYKMQFMDALAEHLKMLVQQDEKIIIGGDYNIAPCIEDGYDAAKFEQEHILCSAVERHKMQQLFNLGFIDTIRIKYPPMISNNKDVFSWWDYRAGSYQQNKGYRIDHLLLSCEAADVFKDCGIDRHIREFNKPSDHAPVWVSLD